MLDEYVLVPDIFDRAAYSDPAYIEMCLPHLKELLFQEALVRDLCDGGWSRHCTENAGGLHRFCKEILKKLIQNNRLSRLPQIGDMLPASPADWCRQGLASHGARPLTGVIAADQTKQAFQEAEVASIEKLTGTSWWQARSPSLKVDRKIHDYSCALDRVFRQANSLMFIDPNLDPSSQNYREFHKLLAPVAQRAIRPAIEIHRSFCKGDGPGRTFPHETDWRTSFEPLHQRLLSLNCSADVFFWNDFHARYLISDVIGISLEAGFDATAKLDDWSTWGRLGRTDKDDIQRMFDPASGTDGLKWRFKIGT